MKPSTAVGTPAREWICSSCKHRIQQRSLARRRPELARYSSSSAHHKSSQQLPGFPARTRFAPSPTGFMHLGSLRTALYNHLLARATRGQFILRIEDTDTKRTVPGALDRICRDLEWAGLQWDEGPEVGGEYGPYQQSERVATYRQHAHQLLEGDHAYRCFCSAERLQTLAQERAKSGLPIEYDGACSTISKAESDDRAHKGETHTIRFNSRGQYPGYNDLVYGKVGNELRGSSSRPASRNKSNEAPVLLKSDGFPTYHLANVVDDHLMRITHVVRAAEWMPSTPKHIALYHAFGWEPPLFAHVGLLQDGKGQKLSKRNADIDVESYKRSGYFPEALVNFCALLGWSHARESDLMSIQELIDSFTLKFTKGNTQVTFKKLDFLQKRHAERYVEGRGQQFEKMINDIQAELQKRQKEGRPLASPPGKDTRTFIGALLTTEAQKYLSPQKFLDDYEALFQAEVKHLDQKVDLDAETVAALIQALNGIPEGKWEVSGLANAVNMVARTYLQRQNLQDDEKELKRASVQCNKFLRWAILSAPGPPVANCMELLGRDSTLARLSRLEGQKSPVVQ